MPLQYTRLLLSLVRWSTETQAMKEIVNNVVSDAAIEIILPPRAKSRVRCLAVCLCCEQADQPMDDDGCGICDACLGLSARETDDFDILDFPGSSFHLTPTTRNR